MKRKHGLLLFLASCIPGCGQMYQGYMKRGVSILTVLSLLFVLALMLGVGALTLLALPIWLFAFFDSYNLRGQTDAQAEANPDGWLFGLGSMDAAKLNRLMRRQHSLVGWGLVALGVWVLYSTVVDWILSWMPDGIWDQWWLRSLLRYNIPRIVVTVGIIALGVWFIRGPKKSDEPPVFMPPAGQEEAPHGDE